jgi:hypothetical protein
VGVGVVPETAGVRLDGPASVGDLHLGSMGSQSESLGLWNEDKTDTDYI